MGKRGRDAAAADYKPTGMDRSEGSVPEKIPIPWAQGFDLRAVLSKSRKVTVTKGRIRYGKDTQIAAPSSL